MSVSIKFEVEAIGASVMTFEVIFGAEIQAQNKLKMLAGFELEGQIAHVHLW